MTEIPTICEEIFSESSSLRGICKIKLETFGTIANVTGTIALAVFAFFQLLISKNSDETFKSQVKAAEFAERAWITIAPDGYRVVGMSPAGKTNGSIDIEVLLMNVGKSPASAVTLDLYHVRAGRSALEEQKRRCPPDWQNNEEKLGDLLFQNDTLSVKKIRSVNIPTSYAKPGLWQYIVGCIRYTWGENRYRGTTSVIWSVGSKQPDFSFMKSLEPSKFDMYWYQDQMTKEEGGRFVY